TALANLRLSLSLRGITPKQRLSVFINEKPAATIEIEKDWKTYDVTLPKEALLRGENRLRLTFKSAGPLAGPGLARQRRAPAIDRIAIGPGDAAALPQPRMVREQTLGGVARPAIAVPGGASRLSYYLQIPEAALSPALLVAQGSEANGTTALV